MVITGPETTLPLFRDLVNETDVINGEYSIHWLEQNLKAKTEAGG
jgi:acetyl-CoA carboxylase biotin carboxylase subunit